MDQTTAMTASDGTPAVGAGGALDPAAVLELADRLRDDEVPSSEAAQVDLLRALEVLKCAAEAAQAVTAVALDRTAREREAARGVAVERQGRGVAAQVALARRESPHLGRQHLGLAKVASVELPHTFAAWRAGRVTEWTVTVLGRETGCLSLEDRLRIDAELAADPARIEAMGTRQVAEAARKRASELDPASVAARRASAEADRHVSIRPAPDTMTWVTGLLPVKDGVAVYAALKAAADAARAVGDERSRGQVMADTLVARVIGASTGQQGRAVVPVHVDAVIDLDALMGETEAAAYVPGHGPVPAAAVRQWVADTAAAGLGTELRRVFARAGRLVAMESSSREFPDGLARFIAIRDQHCRTPWCHAPIRHTDHVVPHADGGATSEANGQGLCEACNYAKQALDWRSRPRPGPGHTVETITPTGHRYTTAAPPPVGSGRHRPVVMEIYRPMPRVDFVA